MKTIKVSEASGAVLDWLVAKCEGLELIKDGVLNGVTKKGRFASGYYTDRNNWAPLSTLCYSTDWAQGGPIIDREFICTNGDDGAPGCAPSWEASIFDDGEVTVSGPTPLIAAMRCYVASKLGETAEVPEELV